MLWPGPTDADVEADFDTTMSGCETVLVTLAELFDVFGSPENVAVAALVMLAGRPEVPTVAVTFVGQARGAARSREVDGAGDVPGPAGRRAGRAAEPLHVQLHDAMPVGLASLITTPDAAPGPRW